MPDVAPVTRAFSPWRSSCGIVVMNPHLKDTHSSAPRRGGSPEKYRACLHHAPSARTYVSVAVRRRNFAWTSAASKASETTMSSPHNRSTCAFVRARPGISRYSARMSMSHSSTCVSVLDMLSLDAVWAVVRNIEAGDFVEATVRLDGVEHHVPSCPRDSVHKPLAMTTQLLFLPWCDSPHFIERDGVIEGRRFNDQSLIQRENPGVGVLVGGSQHRRSSAIPYDNHRRPVGVDSPNLGWPHRVRINEPFVQGYQYLRGEVGGAFVAPGCGRPTEHLPRHLGCEDSANIAGAVHPLFERLLDDHRGAIRHFSSPLSMQLGYSLVGRSARIPRASVGGGSEPPRSQSAQNPVTPCGVLYGMGALVTSSSHP